MPGTKWIPSQTAWQQPFCTEHGADSPGADSPGALAGGVQNGIIWRCHLSLFSAAAKHWIQTRGRGVSPDSTWGVFIWIRDLRSTLPGQRHCCSEQPHPPVWRRHPLTVGQGSLPRLWLYTQTHQGGWGFFLPFSVLRNYKQTNKQKSRECRGMEIAPAWESGVLSALPQQHWRWVIYWVYSPTCFHLLWCHTCSSRITRRLKKTVCVTVLWKQRLLCTCKAALSTIIMECPSLRMTITIFFFLLIAFNQKHCIKKRENISLNLSSWGLSTFNCQLHMKENRYFPQPIFQKGENICYH